MCIYIYVCVYLSIDRYRYISPENSRLPSPLRYDMSKHYTEIKNLDDMTERDWRIFREDNEIATKGNMRHPGTGKVRRL